MMNTTPSTEQIAEWRRRAADGTITTDELRQAIHWLRLTRGKVPASTDKPTKSAREKAPSPNIGQLLSNFLTPKKPE